MQEGLTSDEARTRLRQYGPNVVSEPAVHESRDTLPKPVAMWSLSAQHEAESREVSIDMPEPVEEFLDDSLVFFDHIEAIEPACELLLDLLEPAE